MASRVSRILILCKTYPSPSGKHVETSCVAGMDGDGNLVRLFPVPFRFVDDDKQFKKWQWVTVRIEKAPKDHRPESYKIFVDTIAREGDPLPTKNNWQARRDELRKITVFDDFQALDAARANKGATLGLVRPARVLGLDITPAKVAEWTDDEREKLLQEQQQGGLFADTDRKSIATLKKIPFDFHYRYECRIGNEAREYRHKIVDWEAGALYLNCRRRYGAKWEAPFRQKLEQELSAADLQFLMGTIHRFPKQWLIVSLIYPPRQSTEPHQGMLFAV